jgi:hypothetical protein
MKVVKARSLDRHDRKRFVELAFEKKARVSLDTQRALEFAKKVDAIAHTNETWCEQKKRK